MICTAPCIPSCSNEASRTLLNHQSRAVLGHNCEDHLAPLLVAKKNAQPDYDAVALPQEKTNVQE